MIPPPLDGGGLATLGFKRYDFELMNNPYASPNYAPPPGGFGAPTGEPMYRAQESAAPQATEASVDFLRQTKPWVTFLSVMGFIGSGLLLLSSVFMMIAGALAPSSGSPFPPFLLGVIYIPLAFVYIYPSLKLWGYSGAIGRLVTSRSTVDLEAALAQQKSFWKFIGIFTIVMMIVYGFVLVGAMVAGFALASHH